MSFPHQFSGQDKICSLLLDLRPGDSDLISLAEAHGHFIREGTRAEIHVNDFPPDLPQQIGNLFLASLVRQLTSSTVAFSFVSVRGSYLGPLASFPRVS